MKKHTKEIIFIIFVFAGAITIVLLNFRDPDFWSANIVQVLTLVISVFLSFFLVQRFTDKRRKIDCYEEILNNIQETICLNEIIFSNSQEALLLQKSVANKIKHLKDHSFKEVQSDLEYIDNEFTELRQLYSNHQQSSDSLQSIELDLTRHKTNISGKIDKIMLTLYDI